MSIHVQAPQPNEQCDADCIALAKVAIAYNKTGGGVGRLTFCAHHFAAMNAEAKAKIIAKVELAVMSHA